MRGLSVIAGTLAIAVAPAAASASTSLVEVRDAGGTLLARDAGGAFAFPPRGEVLRVADAVADGRRVVLRGVSFLGGKVRADRVVVPAAGLAGARVEGLRVGRKRYPGGANTLVPLGPGSYLVALQQAVAPGLGADRAGTVGLRIHLGVPVSGLPKGGELWIGLARGAATPSPRVQVDGIPSSLLPLYRAAGKRYGVPWEVLAAINRYETGFGANLAVSRKGAVGWMQFLPSTWRRYGTDGNGDGRRNPYDPADAILAAARYLAAAGSTADLARAVYAYNHSGAYVRGVLGQARAYAGAGPSLQPAGVLDPTALGRR